MTKKKKKTSRLHLVIISVNSQYILTTVFSETQNYASAVLSIFTKSMSIQFFLVSKLRIRFMCKDLRTWKTLKEI